LTHDLNPRVLKRRREIIYRSMSRRFPQYKILSLRLEDLLDERVRALPPRGKLPTHPSK
jgi:hypothetical protein